MLSSVRQRPQGAIADAGTGNDAMRLMYQHTATAFVTYQKTGTAGEVPSDDKTGSERV
jgi:hypothetical protein